MPSTVTIGRDRITCVNGTPFFLIGARHMPEGGTPELLRDAGFNAFRALAFGHEVRPAETIPRDLEGIRFWAYLYDRADFSRAATHEHELQAAVRRLRTHPALLCYENFNEPTLLFRTDRFKTEPAVLAAGTARLRELDPDHPIWLAHCCTHTVETLQRFNPCLDIVGANPYPLYLPGMRSHIGVRPDGRMLDCPDQSVHAVGRYTAKMMAVAEGRRPVWMLIQAMANENWFNPAHTPELAAQGRDETRILYPTYSQLRFMVFDAIVHGATGIALSMWKTPAHGEIWDVITRLVGELRALHDALCAAPVPEPAALSYTDLGFTVWDGVRLLARRRRDTVTVFAVNTQFDPAQVTIRMPCLEGANHVQVVTEARELPLESGAFSDRFEPYDVHVYRGVAAR